MGFWQRYVKRLRVASGYHEHDRECPRLKAHYDTHSALLEFGTSVDDHDDDMSIDIISSSSVSSVVASRERVNLPQAFLLLRLQV